MEHTRKTYTKEFRIKAVELSNERRSVISVAQELDIAHETLRRWKKQYNKGKLTLNPMKTKSRDELENIRLRKELRESNLERDILKKAVAIFSRNGL
jgi:transposase